MVRPLNLLHSYSHCYASLTLDTSDLSCLIPPNLSVCILEPRSANSHHFISSFHLYTSPRRYYFLYRESFPNQLKHPARIGVGFFFPYVLAVNNIAFELVFCYLGAAAIG